MRNCITRPVSWRFVRNKALSEAIRAHGYEIFWVFMGIVTSVDNAGRMEGGKHLLRDMLFPLKTEIEPHKIDEYLLGLASRGLIIHYEVDGMWYIQLPKVGRWSKLRGNMSADSEHPQPPEAIVKHWEQLFNDVYTPVVQGIYGVTTEDKDKDKDKDKDYYLVTWNAKMETKIKELTPGRREKLGARMKEKSFVQNWETILDKIKSSPFLSGKKPSPKHPNWRADFDWVIANPENYMKVLEGKYNNELDDFKTRYNL